MNVLLNVNDSRWRDNFLRHVLCDALATLREDARPLWGKMTAPQMVEHLMWAFELSTGQAVVDCPTPEAQRERMRASLHHDKPMPRDFMNPALTSGLPPLRHPSLADAREALRLEVERFLEQSAVAGAIHTHPVFGPIGVEEWTRTHCKHSYHHLLQFGLVK